MQCHCTETVGGRDSPKAQFVWRLKLTTLPQTHWLGWGKSLPIHHAIVPFGRGVTADALCTSIPSHFFYSFRRLWWSPLARVHKLVVWVVCLCTTQTSRCTSYLIFLCAVCDSWQTFEMRVDIRGVCIGCGCNLFQFAYYTVE